MRVSFSWLQEYLDLKMTASELAQKLTFAGLETNVVAKQKPYGLDKVVVGEIKDIRNHNNNSHLLVCEVDVGDKANLHIVTGAPNVRLSQKVAVALPGSTLATGVQIEKTYFGEEISEGMLCSAKELGLDADLYSTDGADKEGIMVLPFDLSPGLNLQEALELDDDLLEVDLTPNRADCMAVINLCREIAAVTNSSFRLPIFELKESYKKTEEMIKVEIQNPELCPRYVARIVEDIKVGPSPSWLVNKLRSAGVRSINNVVDITNFVMLEYGQPIHAFDYDVLETPKIIVRTAFDKEEIITLDGVERKLDSSVLLIADEQKALAIAGVMGGLQSGITSDTKNVLIESACFNNTSIRRTSKLLKLSSEASLRFEKGVVDIEAAALAAQRVAYLLATLAQGKVLKGAVDNYPLPPKIPVINLRPRRLQKILEQELSEQTIISYLKRLHFEVENKGDSLEVRVPSYRKDLTLEVDLIEEVARLYDYNRLPSLLPVGRVSQRPKAKGWAREEEVRSRMVLFGLTEIITYSFIDPKSFDKLRLPASHSWRNVLFLKNPISEEQSVMRTTLLPGLLLTAQKNFNYQVKNLAFFETGKVFHPLVDSVLPEEKLMLGALSAGYTRGDWQVKPQPLDFYFLKGVAEKFLKENGFKPQFLPAADFSFLHPYRRAEIKIGEQTVGYLGELHPLTLEAYDLKERVYVLEIDLTLLDRLPRREGRAYFLPRYPFVVRDLAFIVKEEIPVALLEEVIAEAGGEILRDFHLFDLYTGEQIPPGHKSLAYSLVYQSEQHTLTEEEINASLKRILDLLRERFGVELR